MFSLSVAVADHYETPSPYSGLLAGVFPLVPKAASGGLVPEFSPDVSAALAEFASLGWRNEQLDVCYHPGAQILLEQQLH